MENDFKLKYPEIPWKEMSRLRDKIIHHYHGEDYETIWTISTKEIPELKIQISKILNSYS